MSIVDTVRAWASDAVDSASRFSDAIGEWFNRLPNTGSPVVAALKAGNAAIDAGVKAGQGESLAVAVAESVEAYAEGGDLGRQITDVNATVASAVESVRETVADLASGPPLWVKIIIAGAVVVGVVYVFEGVVSHARQAA